MKDLTPAVKKIIPIISIVLCLNLNNLKAAGQTALGIPEGLYNGNITFNVNGDVRPGRFWIVASNDFIFGLVSLRKYTLPLIFSTIHLLDCSDDFNFVYKNRALKLKSNSSASFQANGTGKLVSAGNGNPYQGFYFSKGDQNTALMNVSADGKAIIILGVYIDADVFYGEIDSMGNFTKITGSRNVKISIKPLSSDSFSIVSKHYRGEELVISKVRSEEIIAIDNDFKFVCGDGR